MKIYPKGQTPIKRSISFSRGLFLEPKVCLLCITFAYLRLNAIRNIDQNTRYSNFLAVSFIHPRYLQYYLRSATDADEMWLESSAHWGHFSGNCS